MAQQSIEAAGTPIDLAAAAIGVGLSHPVRIAILRLLAEQDELCSCEIEPRFDLDPSGVSRHLSALRDAGLVASRRDGVRTLHRLTARAVVRLLESVDRVALRAEGIHHAPFATLSVRVPSEVTRRGSHEKR